MRDRIVAVFLDARARAGYRWLAMVKTLRAVDFRCWTELALDMPDSGGIFVGPNAQGKTSILEAVCVLLRLQSPRTHKMASMVRRSTSGFGIAGDVQGLRRKVRCGAGGMVCEVEGESRATSADYLADSGLVVWMGNEDLELIRDGGERRRRYLDFMGFQWDPGYRRHWSRYRRALKMKNALLKERHHDEKQIAAYEEIMVESGEALAMTRAAMIDALQPLAAAAQAAVSGTSENLQIAYRPAGSRDMRAGLQQSHERERRTRQSVTGPHRDDLVLTVNGLDACEFASEGQQRTLALSLKLAQGSLLQARSGVPPVYLLDDIFGELDGTRRNALMNALPADAQKWITTTTLDWLKEDPAYQQIPRFGVNEGKVGLL